MSDNRSSDPRLATEHGLSILLETERYRILLDTGASDLFIKNATLLGVDLGSVDFVFISHGHSDHAGGLPYLLQCNKQAKVIVSPEAMSHQFYSKRGNLHCITAPWPEIDHDRLLRIDQTCEIEAGLYVIARMPQLYPTPIGNKNLFIKEPDGTFVSDTFAHELALYADGLLFTGCAHSGLENILAACPWPVHTVIGGFHLLDSMEPEAELLRLAHKLKTNYPQTTFYTSHCTGNQAFATLKSILGPQLQAFGL